MAPPLLFTISKLVGRVLPLPPWLLSSNCKLTPEVTPLVSGPDDRLA
jgi:hypothetical protein